MIFCVEALDTTLPFCDSLFAVHLFVHAVVARKAISKALDRIDTFSAMQHKSTCLVYNPVGCCYVALVINARNCRSRLPFSTQISSGRNQSHCLYPSTAIRVSEPGKNLTYRNGQGKGKFSRRPLYRSLLEDKELPK